MSPSDASPAIPPNETAPTLQYCARCLEPSSRPGATFDEKGVCVPCRYAASLESIDWEARHTDLQEIADNVTVEVIRGTGVQSLMNTQEIKK